MITPKERKKIARLKKKQNEILLQAYKLDGSENQNVQSLNDRYNAIEKEIKNIEFKIK